MTDSAQQPSYIVRNAADVNRLINTSSGKSVNARMIVTIALGGIFLDAYDLGALAFGVKDITQQFALNATQVGLVVSAITFGAIIGALLGGYLTDKIGRYRVFMADMFFFVFAAILGALAPNAEILTLSRFIMGLGIGIDLPVAMAFLAEFSRLKGRGNKAAKVAMWCPTWYAAISFAYLLVLALYSFLPESQSPHLWRYIVGFGAVPALVILMIRKKYMTESPLWAAQQGDLTTAVSILNTTYRIPVQIEEGAASQSSSIPTPPPWAAYRALFRGHYTKRTLLNCVLSFVSPFAYAAIAFGLPIIISTLFEQSLLTTILVSLALNFFFALTGGMLAVRWVAIIGARPLATVGYGLQIVALLGLAWLGKPQHTLDAIYCFGLLALFLFGQGIGPGAQSMVYASLSYPASLRGVGVGLNQTVTRISSTIALFIFPLLTLHLGTQLFWVIACAPALGFIALKVIGWEPAGYDVDAEEYA